MRSMKSYLALILTLAMALSLGAVPAAAAPEAEMAETVLVDCDEATMTVTGYDPNGEWGPTFELLLENKSDQDLFFSLDDLAVDGVMCDPFWGETVPAGTKSYSDVSWYDFELEEAGINYIASVKGMANIWDDDTYEDVYVGPVAWELTLGETDLPPAEPLVFDTGIEPIELFNAGGVRCTVVDYGFEETPTITFYMENTTDESVFFTIDGVTVNGFNCDPFWGSTVTAGAVGYSQCEWFDSDLEDSHIETVQSVAFTAQALTDDWDVIAEGECTLGDASAAAPAAEPAAEEPSAEEPAAEEPAAEEPAAEEPIQLDEEVAALMGSAADGTYVNDYFGLTFTPPEDWRFYSLEEILERQGMAAENFSGTEMGDQIETFLESDSGFSVMMAEKEGGIQNVNALVESLPGLTKYLSESELLDLVESQLGLEEGGDMSEMGLEGAILTRNTFTFAGQEHESLRVDYTDTSMGVELPMYMQMVFVMAEDYVMQITITTVFEDLTADVGAMFTVAE